MDGLLTAYVVFAFVLQGLLALNFAARNWWPALERQYGWIIYAFGLPSLAIGVLMLVDSRAWYYVVPPLLLTSWAVFGFRVDIWRPVSWRNPPRWSIFGPYVGTYVASLLLFWGSMWTVGPAYWIVFGCTYVLHTALNVYSHRRSVPYGAARKS